MGRDENIEIFEDTLRLCRENEIIEKATKASKDAQKLILESDKLRIRRNDIYDTPASIVVSSKRSFEAAASYTNLRVCVHNFASASNPGGGVERGSTAQEECLCRCSNLYPCLKANYLWCKFYKPHRMAKDPLHNDDIIYTPEILVFKCDASRPKLMQAQNWFKVNVITCAAPNLRQRPSNSYNSGDGNVAVKITDKKLLQIHEKRLRRILDVAYQYGNEVIILGAFGCGAFVNNPTVVATAAKNVIKDYLHKFKTIEFAVYCNPKDDTNYRTFKRTLS